MSSRLIQARYDRLTSQKVVGNAYSDHDLLAGLYEVAVDAAEANDPTLSFNAYDYIGVSVMGVDPLTWPEFVDCLTFWHKEVA